jgi:hypothetical protein
MDDTFGPALFFTLAGLIGGIVLFARGLIAYRRDRLISSVATSSLDGIAAGEVRISGTVEAIDQHLVSPLQSKPCVWYRARIEETGDNGRVLLNEERAQEFRIRNETGDIRVVPRGARWEIDSAFDESTGITGAEPPGLHLRRGGAFAQSLDRDPDVMTEAQKEAARQALLTVQPPQPTTALSRVAGAGWAWSSFGGTSDAGMSIGERGKRYREARVDVGETVTVLGQALPWGDVKDQLHAWDPSSNVEMAIADDIARARELGTLAASPEEAWGNAAIPGFGIGAPTVTPALDPRARPQAGLGDEAHAEALARYDIPADELVLTRDPKGEMAIYAGPPQQAVMQHDFAFALGVMGALMAVFCALGLGAVLTGTL